MERKWWHSKTAYQIYPKSFADGNNDGIGDLKGIIQKLDYLKDLGIDIIWISPIYKSPFADQGYDISDYYAIDPLFGDMEQMEELLSEAKKRDMHILMDLVVNHCSDEHEWFKKACEDPDGEYGQYFYILDHKDGEKLPSNLRSYFGGSVWEPLPGHPDKIYLHAFHKKQPDLNWENPALRKEIYKMINWWLEKGLSGFRLDAIMNIKKKLPFSDFPADREDGLCSFNKQVEAVDGVMDYLQEMADETFRKYDCFTIGEVFNFKEDELPLFIGDKGCFSCMFDFGQEVIDKNILGWYASKQATPEEYKKSCFQSQATIADIGMISNIIENHDEPRGVSRYIPEGECTEKGKKMLGAIKLLTKGLPFIYQGQELGMENRTFTDIAEVRDCNTIDEYQVALAAGLSEKEALQQVGKYSRDNARSPFQWSSEAYAGFSKTTPWILVNDNYTRINLEEEKKNPQSVYHFYKKLIALRKNPIYGETIVYGDCIPFMEKEENLMAYYRRGEKTLLAIANFRKEERTIEIPSAIKEVLLTNEEEKDFLGKTTITLDGYGFVFIAL